MLDTDHQPQLALGPGRPEERHELPVPTSTGSRHRTALFDRDPSDPLFSTGEVPAHRPGTTDPIIDPRLLAESDDGSVTVLLPEVSGTAVIRFCTSQTGLLRDLPIFSRYAFDPRRLRNTAACRRLTDLDPAQVVEVTTVVPDERSLADQDHSDWTEHGLTGDLLAAMLRSSLIDDHRIWLIAPGDPLVPFLEVVVGDNVLHRVGRRRLGAQANAGPWCVDPLEVVNRLLDLRAGDERHWMTMTLSKALEGIRTGSSGTDRELRSRGVRTSRGGLQRIVPFRMSPTAVAVIVALVCVIAPALHLVIYRKPPPTAPLVVIAGLVGCMASTAVWNRHVRSREDRELGRLLMADSVVDRVEVDRGEVQVL